MRCKKISLIKAEVVTRGAVSVVYRSGPLTQQLCTTIQIHKEARVLESLADFLSDLTVVYNSADLPTHGTGAYFEEVKSRNEYRVHVATELNEYKKSMRELALNNTANEVANMLLPESGFKWDSDINSANNEFTITLTVVK